MLITKQNEIKVQEHDRIGFNQNMGRDTSSFLEVTVALYLNLSYTNICCIMCIYNVCMKSFILLDIISLS